jgi:predicted PurR-regulated permease PerM
MTPNQQQFVAWSAITAVAGLVLWVLSPVLMPFVVAAVLAYVLSPLVKGLLRISAGALPVLLAVGVVELLFLIVALAILLLVVPILAKELPLMREQLPGLLLKAQAVLAPWLKELGIEMALDPASLKAFIIKYFNTSVEDSLDGWLTSLRIGGSVALAVVGNVILIPVALFYLLADWDRFVAHVVGLVPQRMRPGFDGFVAEVDEVLGQYLRGQLTVMVILAVFYSAGLALFGLDLALPIGVFSGLAVVIPYLGFGVGLVLALLAGLLQFAAWKAAVMVAVVFGLGQLLEGFVLTPRLVGERIGLHPLAVIFALLAFGQVFGFVGVLVALPASAILLVCLRRARQRYLASQLFTG